MTVKGKGDGRVPILLVDDRIAWSLGRPGHGDPFPIRRDRGPIHGETAAAHHDRGPVRGETAAIRHDLGPNHGEPAVFATIAVRFVVNRPPFAMIWGQLAVNRPRSP